MVKQQQEKYLTPGRVLTPSQYAVYKYQRKTLKRQKLLSEMKKKSPEVAGVQSQEAYEQTRSGKVSRGLIHAARFVRQPGQTLYRRRLPVSTSRIKRPMPTPAQMQMLQAAAKQQAEKNNWAWIFTDMRNNSANQAAIVERELLSSGGAGYSMEGARTAAAIGNEAFNIGTLGHVLPVLSVEGEVLGHSKRGHKATNDMISEVLAVSNLIP